MKMTDKNSIYILTIGLCLGFLWGAVPLQAEQVEAKPTSFEKALYDKTRYEVLKDVNDEDFVSYCITQKLGSEFLVNIRAEIFNLEAQIESARAKGVDDNSPQIKTINSSLNIKRRQLVAEIKSTRRGLELEAAIAKATLAELNKEKK